MTYILGNAWILLRAIIMIGFMELRTKPISGRQAISLMKKDYAADLRSTAYGLSLMTLAIHLSWFNNAHGY